MANNSANTMSGCPACSQKNQRQRHLHFLEISEQTDLAAHLKAQEPDEKADQNPARISAIVAWVRTIKETYGKPADEKTGHPMPIWRAWQNAQQYDIQKRHTAQEKSDQVPADIVWKFPERKVTRESPHPRR